MPNEHRSPFEEQLARRLRGIAIIPPRDLAARVLQAAQPAAPDNAQDWILRLRRSLLVPLAGLLILATIATGTAIAGQSLLSEDLLRYLARLGLGSATDQPASVSASATDQGIMVQAAGLYSDSRLVAIAVEARNSDDASAVYQIAINAFGAEAGPPVHTRLRSEDGTWHNLMGMVADADDPARIVLIFRPNDAQTTSAARFVLEVTGVERYTSEPSHKFVAGRWELPITIPQAQQHLQDLAALQPGRVGPVDVQFGAFSSSDSHIGGRIALAAQTPAELAPPLPPATAKVGPDGAPRPVRGRELAQGVGIELYGPDGELAHPIYLDGLPTPGYGKPEAQVTALWPRGAPGTYRLVIWYGDGASIERTLQIP